MTTTIITTINNNNNKGIDLPLLHKEKLDVLITIPYIVADTILPRITIEATLAGTECELTKNVGIFITINTEKNKNKTK